MKVKPNYMLREVLDVYVVIGIGSGAYEPNRIMSLNETGAFLWKLMEQDRQKAELIDALTGEFDVDARTAERDLDVFLSQLRGKALLEE